MDKHLRLASLGMMSRSKISPSWGFRKLAVSRDTCTWNISPCSTSKLLLAIAILQRIHAVQAALAEALGHSLCQDQRGESAVFVRDAYLKPAVGHVARIPLATMPMAATLVIGLYMVPTLKRGNCTPPGMQAVTGLSVNHQCASRGACENCVLGTA